MINPDALAALKDGQRQIDAEGVEVGVSRQALEEAIQALEAQSAPIPQDREELASLLWEAAGQRLINFVGDSKEAGTCVSWEQWRAHADKYPHSLKRTLDPFYEIADALLEVRKCDS